MLRFAVDGTAVPIQNIPFIRLVQINAGAAQFERTPAPVNAGHRRLDLDQTFQLI